MVGIMHMQLQWESITSVLTFLLCKTGAPHTRYLIVISKMEDKIQKPAHTEPRVCHLLPGISNQVLKESKVRRIVWDLPKAAGTEKSQKLERRK
jgi:hypothetical protein